MLKSSHLAILPIQPTYCPKVSAQSEAPRTDAARSTQLEDFHAAPQCAREDVPVRVAGAPRVDAVGLVLVHDARVGRVREVDEHDASRVPGDDDLVVAWDDLAEVGRAVRDRRVGAAEEGVDGAGVG